jgi:ABC-type dipeptide/oligopeptide/nickel transport system ATPase component
MTATSTAAAPQPVLKIKNLAVSFPSGSGERARAVDGVGFSVYAGQTLALVGESGCGKSVTALSVLGLLPAPPASVDSGTITLSVAGRASDLRTLSAPALRRIRGADAAMIFQEPMTSLNPVMSIGDQVIEAIRLHQRVNRGVARRRAAQALGEVGIEDPKNRLRDYPHEFSGGMRQRVMIAMALACEPALLLADEPTTALDVTIQAQILDLLERLQRERGLAIVLITHDLGLVAQRADTVCVMYGGRLVEAARAGTLLASPTHPYTRALLGAIPSMTVRRSRLTTVAASTADPASFVGLPGLPGGSQAWWPHHANPCGDDTASGRSSLLVPCAPEHWVACWRTATGRELDDPFPEMPPEPAPATTTTPSA